MMGEVHLLFWGTPPKTTMTMENPPFEDVFPIGNGNFSVSHSLFFTQGCNFFFPENLCLQNTTRWWQLKYFWNFHPDPVGDDRV